MLHWELLHFRVLDEDYVQKYEVGTLQENNLNTTDRVSFQPLAPFHKRENHI